jgi:hypothetical protein
MFSPELNIANANARHRTHKSYKKTVEVLPPITINFCQKVEFYLVPQSLKVRFFHFIIAATLYRYKGSETYWTTHDDRTGIAT